MSDTEKKPMPVITDVGPQPSADCLLIRKLRSEIAALKRELLALKNKARNVKI